MLANDTAVTQATDQIGQDRVHYLRLQSPVNPEALATYPSRQGWHRGNPYLQAGRLRPAAGRPARVQRRRLCGRTAFPTLGPADARPCGGAAQPDPAVRAEQRNTVAPPCREQGPFTERRGREPRLPARADRPAAEPVGRDRFVTPALIDSLAARVPRRHAPGKSIMQEECMSVKVGINGFGRIGRNFFRAAWEREVDSSSWR